MKLLVSLTLKLSECYRLLLYGLFAVFGAASALFSDWKALYLCCFFPFLLSALYSRRRVIYIQLILATLIGLSSFFLTNTIYVFPSLSNKALTGKAIIEVTSIIPLEHRMKGWKLSGTIELFITTKGVVAKNVPVLILLQEEKEWGERPVATFRYSIEGMLKQNKYGRYHFVPKRGATWQPIEKAWTLVEWRYRAKEALQSHINTLFDSQHVASFLAGIATGQFDNHALTAELGRFGLQHLMAISGLHFSILAAIIGAIFMILLPRSWAIIVSLLLLTGYFLFLGLSPSVLRAWIAIILGMIALIIGRTHQALNALGAALLAIALWQPYWLTTLSFQFSFGITAAILIWCAPMDHLLQRLFGKRRVMQVCEEGWLSQHAHCILYFLRQMLALSLAVNLAALPLTLYYFNTFPLMGLIYNLFFPTMVSICLLLLLLGLAVGVVWPWGAGIFHTLNERYTAFMLDLTFRLPKEGDFTWQLENIPVWVLLGYLMMLFWGGFIFREIFSVDEKREFAS